jgi:HAD superfamily hydrolase (TIGR01484 family)
MSVIDLVVTDLDGTFWDVEQQVHPTTREALDELTRRSIPWLVATGRRARSTRVPLAALGLAPSAIVLNGAIGLDLESGDRFHCHAFDPAVAREVVAAYAAAGHSPVVYVDHPQYDVFLSESPTTHPDHARNLRPFAGIADLDQVAAEMAVLSFGVIGCSHAPLVEVATRLEGLAETSLDRGLDFPGEGLFNLMVGPFGLSKWTGVEIFCRRAGIDAARVLAIGDGPNDVELLVNAAAALVPSDASESALAVADHVVPPVSAGGWVHLLDFI